MKTPNVYCATCSRPLGVGSQRARYFCDEACEALFQGLHGARDAIIRELGHSAARSNRQIADMLGVSEATVRRVISGR